MTKKNNSKNTTQKKHNRSNTSNKGPGFSRRKIRTHTIRRKHPIIQGKIIESNKDGWIVAEIYGDPFERGFAHGYLLANELKRVKRSLKFIVNQTLKPTTFKEYMQKSKSLINPQMIRHFPEYYQEIQGISAGAKRARCIITTDLLIAWNAYMSLYSFFKDGESGQRCSAFIACGTATKKGDMIMAHNTHSDFITGQLSNVVLYITPAKGFPFVMQTSAGLLASTTDWFLCGSGIIGCETTISDINYKPDFGAPYFCRIRQAMQYGKTLDDYTKIMLENNAGDYACSWLFGDIHSNEIMLFEIGLKEHNIKRTKNGVFYGMNSAIGDKLRERETTDTEWGDLSTSSGARNFRLNYLLNDKYDGTLDIDNAKRIISDHYDVYLGKNVLNFRGICKHSELDGSFGNKHPYSLYGCTDGKVVNTELAKKGEFIGKFGSCCGRGFKIDEHIAKHPEYKEWEEYVDDMPIHKWTLINKG